MPNKLIDDMEILPQQDASKAFFNRILPTTLTFEGGSTTDHAGLTNHGVTQSTYDLYRTRRKMPVQSVNAISENEVKDLYFTEYFKNHRYNMLPENVSGVMFDYGVHSGPNTATKALQAAVGVNADGKIGPVTLNAVNAFIKKNGEKPLVDAILKQRELRLNILTSSNPEKYGRFKAGWQNRINVLRDMYGALNPFSVTEAQAAESPKPGAVMPQMEGTTPQGKMQLVDDMGIFNSPDPKAKHGGLLDDMGVFGPPQVDYGDPGEISVPRGKYIPATKGKTGQKPIGAVEMAIRIAPQWKEKLPFSPIGAVNAVQLAIAAEKVKEGTASKEEEKLVGDYLTQWHQEQNRGVTWGGKVVAGATELPAYMLEFLITGGAATVSKKAAIKASQTAVEKLALEGVKRNLPIKLAKKSAAWVAGAAARTALQPHRIVKGAAERQVQNTIEGGDESTLTSAFKSIGDVMIENMSEVTGEGIQKAAGKLVPEQLAVGIKSLFKKMHPNESVTKLFTKAGYNGFVGEIGEEKLGALLRATVGVEDYDEKNLFKRLLKEEVQFAKDLPVTAGVLAIPGAARSAAGLMIKEKPAQITPQPGPADASSGAHPPVDSGIPEEPAASRPAAQPKTSKPEIPHQFTNPYSPDLLNYLAKYIPPKMVASMSSKERLSLANAPVEQLRDLSVAVENKNNRLVETIKAEITEKAAEQLKNAEIQSPKPAAPTSVISNAPQKPASTIQDPVKPVAESPVKKVPLHEMTVESKQPEFRDITSMTKEEMITEIDALNAKNKANIARLDKIDPNRQRFGTIELSAEEIQRMNELGNAIERIKAQEAAPAIEKIKARKSEAKGKDNFVPDYWRVGGEDGRIGKSLGYNENDEVVLEFPGGKKEAFPPHSLFPAKQSEVNVANSPAREKPIDNAKAKGYTVSEEGSSYYADQIQAGEGKIDNTGKPKSGILQQSPLYTKFKKIGGLIFASEKISSPADVAFAFKNLKNEAVEHFYCVGMKGDSPICVEFISMGSINASLVDPLEVVRLLLNKKADGVYLIHNHPSGNITPSSEDANITTRISKSLKKFGISFHGHIVIDDTKFGFINPQGDMDKLEHKATAESGKKVTLYKKYIEWVESPDTMDLRSGIYRPEDIFEIIKGFTVDFDRSDVVLYLDNRLNIISAEAMPKSADHTKKIIKTATAIRASRVAIATGNKNILAKKIHSELAVSNIDLLDIVRIDKNGEFESYSGNNKLQGNERAMPGGVSESQQDLFGETEAMRSRSWGVSMPTEPATKKTINKTEIITWVEKTFRIPIKSKATHRFRNLAGWYQTRQQIVRLRRWGELEPLTHELAHHIDKQMRKTLGVHWRGKNIPKQQRQAAIKELESLDYDQTKRRTSEGFAEYMRYYLTTDESGKKAPVFDKFFRETFLKDNPALAKNINTLKSMMNTWQQQGSENRVLEQIDFGGEHTDILSVRTKLQKAWDWVNKNFNDEFYLIQKIEEQIGIKSGVNIKPTQDPYALATYAKSKASIVARTFVLEKAVDETGKVLGPGLKEILKPITPEKMRQFIAYGVAKRALLLVQRNIESGIDLEDARHIVEKYKDMGWDDTLDQITKWADHLLGWLIRAGGLGEAEAAAIRQANPIYLPFKRAFIDELDVIRGAGGTFANRGQAVKRMKGSGRPIINPIESLIQQATEMIFKAQKINVARAIANLAEKEGVGGFITRVPAPLEARTYSLKQLKDSLETLGVDLSEANMDDMLTVFSQGWQYRGKDNIVSIWRNGERQFYELHPDLYRALLGLDNYEREWWMKVGAPFARILRLGATGIKFAFGLVRNPWRDALSYAVLSKHKSSIPVVDTITGVTKEIFAKPGDLAWRFKAVGGSLSGMMGFDRAATMAVYDDLVNSKLKASNKVIRAMNPKNVPHTIAYLIDQLRAGLNVTELGPRISELEKSHQKYQKEHPDWTEEDCFIAAFNDAQDVTINFTKSGYIGKRINEVVAFFNANIRGIEKTARTIKERPISFIVKGVVWLTAFTIMNWFRNREKQWYKNLPPEYRYGNVFIEIDDQTIIRLPIPFEVGILFMSAPAAALDSMEAQDPKYIDSLWKLVRQQTPVRWPSIVQPVVDVISNKNYYGAPIETKGMDYLPTSERKTRRTSPWAVALNKVFPTVSPVQIQYLVEQYTGGGVKQFQGGGKELSDIPVLSDILLHMPDRPNRQIGEFWIEWENLSYKKRTRTLQRGELTRFNKLKAVHQRLREIQDDARKADNAGRIRKRDYYYRKLQRVLDKAGY